MHCPIRGGSVFRCFFCGGIKVHLPCLMIIKGNKFDFVAGAMSLACLTHDS